MSDADDVQGRRCPYCGQLIFGTLMEHYAPHVLYCPGDAPAPPARPSQVETPVQAPDPNRPKPH